MSEPTALRLPHNLPYPITIQRLYLRPSTSSTPTSLKKTDVLLSYSYYVKTAEGGKEKEIKSWESPVEGDLVRWCAREGDVLRNANDAIIYIQEPCTHDVQFNGMCALCAKDLSRDDYTGFSDTSRAKISMAHDVEGLTVSLAEANRLETATTERLLSSKKLSLIVDLDQTIVHATVDPTVGEWLADERNPNFKALSGTGKFKLGDEIDARTGESCYYYVKMRPGLNDFLKNVSNMYEMHVYTMGTRAYAVEVCKIIDPSGALFGGRILSRDESGSMTRKSLQRLFPCDTNMVVIIDDRSDVWDGSPNLLKVIPYEFFVGIGDINAAFLPKKKDLIAPPVNPAAVPSATDLATAASSEASTSAIPLSDSGTVDISVLEGVPSPFNTDATIISPSIVEAEASTALTISDQIENRPLSKTSRSHRAETGNSSDTSTEHDVLEENGVEEDEEEMEAVLVDDDVELDRLFGLLNSVHAEFFRNVDRGADVKIIIPKMKQAILRGVHLVFSGLIQLGVKPEESEYWKIATTFGAKCSSDLNSRVTHVVASQNGTEKVHQARKRRNIKIVGAQWLLDCVSNWTHVPESLYLLPPPSPIPTSTSLPRSTTPTADVPSSPPPSLPEFEDPEEEIIQPDEAREVEASGSRAGSVLGNDEDLDIAEMDWRDAAKEIEDAMNETDEDEDGDGASDGDENTTDEGDLTDSSVRSEPSNGNGLTHLDSKKREREDAKGKGKLSDSEAAGSPLQKRIKRTRSRKSGLKISYPAVSGNDDDDEDTEDTLPSAKIPDLIKKAGGSTKALVEGDEGGGPGYEASVGGSSSLDSDDEAFFASMAAEVESEWA